MEQKRFDTVLVCSGGGVYGAAQAGMLAELAAAGFKPDAIVGVSAGALNGTFMAAGFTVQRAQELVDIWEGLDRRDVFPARPAVQLLHVIAGHGAVQPDKGLRSLVARCTPVLDLADAQIPVHVGAVCVATGELVWWSSGEAVPRLCASAALPGVVKPVEVEGRLFFDGGILANVPVPRAVALGARRVVVVDVSPSTRKDGAPDSALGALLRAFGHVRTALHEHQQQHLPPHVEVIRIAGDLPDVGANAFDRGKELVAAGRLHVLRALDARPEIVEVLEPRDEPRPQRTYRISNWLRHRRTTDGRR